MYPIVASIIFSTNLLALSSLEIGKSKNLANLSNSIFFVNKLFKNIDASSLLLIFFI
jgi:hypothetical protein